MFPGTDDDDTILKRNVELDRFRPPHAPISRSVNVIDERTEDELARGQVLLIR